MTQMQRGIQVTRQIHDEKERKKIMKAKFYEPGTLNYGLFHKQKITDFMQAAYDRRKKLREEKYGPKN